MHCCRTINLVLICMAVSNPDRTLLLNGIFGKFDELELAPIVQHIVIASFN